MVTRSTTLTAGVVSDPVCVLVYPVNQRGICQQVYPRRHVPWSFRNKVLNSYSVTSEVMRKFEKAMLRICYLISLGYEKKKKNCCGQQAVSSFLTTHRWISLPTSVELPHALSPQTSCRLLPTRTTHPHKRTFSCVQVTSTHPLITGRKECTRDIFLNHKHTHTRIESPFISLY